MGNGYFKYTRDFGEHWANLRIVNSPQNSEEDDFSEADQELIGQPDPAFETRIIGINWVVDLTSGTLTWLGKAPPLTSSTLSYLRGDNEYILIRKVPGKYLRKGLLTKSSLLSWNSAEMKWQPFVLKNTILVHAGRNSELKTFLATQSLQYRVPEADLGSDPADALRNPFGPPGEVVLFDDFDSLKLNIYDKKGTWSPYRVLLDGRVSKPDKLLNAGFGTYFLINGDRLFVRKENEAQWVGTTGLSNFTDQRLLVSTKGNASLLALINEQGDSAWTSTDGGLKWDLSFAGAYLEGLIGTKYAVGHPNDDSESTFDPALISSDGSFKVLVPSSDHPDISESTEKDLQNPSLVLGLRSGRGLFISNGVLWSFEAETMKWSKVDIGTDATLREAVSKFSSDSFDYSTEPSLRAFQDWGDPDGAYISVGNDWFRYAAASGTKKLSSGGIPRPQICFASSQSPQVRLAARGDTLVDELTGAIVKPPESSTITGIYSLPDSGKAIFVATDHGLFYTQDRQGWSKVKLGKSDEPIISFVVASPQLGLMYLITPSGLYAVVERLVRPSPIQGYMEHPEQARKQIEDHWEGICIFFIAALLYGSPIPLRVLAKWEKVNGLSVFVYMILAGEWRAYRYYRERLTRRLTSRREFYFARKGSLPGHDSRQDLVHLLSEAVQNSPVEITGPGGFGKTTLLDALALHRLNTWRRGDRHPLWLRLHTWNGGDVLELVQSSLDEQDLFLNSIVLTLQIQKGKFLFLVDGLNEISEGSQRAFLEQCGKLVSATRPNQIILSSRTPVPQGVRERGFEDSALNTWAIEEFSPEDSREFCAQYLGHLRFRQHTEREPSAVASDLESLVKYINSLPQIPLILREAVRTYHETGVAPRDRLSVFHEYLSSAVNPDKRKSKIPAAALREVFEAVSWMRLKNRNSLRVVSDKAQTKLLEEATSKLDLMKRYDEIPAHSFSILEILLDCGLFVREGGGIRVWHDSIEDYAAAYHFVDVVYPESPQEALKHLGELRSSVTHNDFLGLVAALAHQMHVYELSRYWSVS